MYHASSRFCYSDQQMHYICTDKQYFVYHKHSYMFRCICIIFRESYSTVLKLQKSLRLQLSKISRLKYLGVGILTVYKILLIYVCVYTHIWGLG
jgi:hypothetical protein